MGLATSLPLAKKDLLESATGSALLVYTAYAFLDNPHLLLLFMGVLGLPLFLLSHDAENLKSLPLSSSMVVSKVWIMWYFPVGQNCEASLYSHTRIKSSFRLFIPTHFSGFSLTLRCLYFNTIEGLALGNSLLWGLHPFCPLDAPSS